MNHIPLNQVLLILTGQETQNTNLMFTDLTITAIIMVTIIELLLTFGTWKMNLTNKNKN